MQREHSWNSVYRNLFGVAVFVDFTDDDLHGLTLGAKNIYNNRPGNESTAQNGDLRPFEVSGKFPKRDGLSYLTKDDLSNVGNTRSNLAPRRAEDSELHSRILYMHPHGGFGEMDPLGGLAQKGHRYAGLLIQNSEGYHQMNQFTFKMKGTCLRRLQIMPVMTKRIGDSYTDSGYAYAGGSDYDPYFVAGDATSNADEAASGALRLTNKSLVARGPGLITGTFRQVEVD